MLVVCIEVPNLRRDRFYRALTGLCAVLPKAVDQALLPEFFPISVVGFRDAVGIERKQISGSKFEVSEAALPILEQAEQRTGGLEVMALVVGAQDKSREVSAVGITQAP